MNFYPTLLSRITDWDHNPSSPLKMTGISNKAWPYFLHLFLKEKSHSFSDKNHILICPTLEAAESTHSSLREAFPDKKIHLFPGLESSPYCGYFASELNLYKRFQVLSDLVTSTNPQIIICTNEAFSQKLPPASFFTENSLKILISDIISPLDLAGKLVAIGYQSAITVEEPGTFARKGEIFDIYPISGGPIRIHYFDDMVEEIFSIDSATQKTLRDKPYQEISLPPAPGALTQKEYTTNLREKIPMPETKFKDRFEKRKELFAKLSSGQLFENYPVFLAMFFKETSFLMDYLTKNESVLHLLSEVESSQNINEFFDLIQDEFAREASETDSDLLLNHPSELYFLDFHKKIEAYPLILVNDLEILTNFEEGIQSKVELHLEKTKTYLKNRVNPALSKSEFLKKSLETLKEEFKRDGQIVFTTIHEGSKKEIQHVLELLDFSRELSSRIHFIDYKIDEGFYYQREKVLLISDGDLFAAKKMNKARPTKKNVDLFAEQLATLKKGDFVVHSTHGVGEYLGLESLDMGGHQSDYIVLLYDNDDKIYVPVYKMNLLQKYADATAGLRPANLRTLKFQTAKKKARESAKTLAFDLLKLQAERESQVAHSYAPAGEEYKEFELAFPFEPTPDQLTAIYDVTDAMEKPKPMDHLVCGDVGFGKTEVAMRAAYKAVLDGKQVAVLVPTTILALQHYESFNKRFKEFPVSVDFLSRFKSPKQTKEVLERLEKGSVDIVIGTHKLLSNLIKFRDLGLVVVDEEQRFGVGHKEKLKLLKATVDFLTLTATPIPRTLQLAFLGLRELSLIQTAPPRRQSIKTYLIKEDDYTIKSAIEKELNRGGQIFIVHNKVQDMDQYSSYIRELAPEAKIISAHGQLAEKDLENRIRAFYNGEYQILIATTIIESGIDIPNANTMIIDRADTFGLSQLHQLRGRIGRSDKKAYAYFVIPKTRALTPIAEQRLKALQTYADLGSGFSIASSDLEIRGAGDILGAKQSGHIDSIGLELYMELLKEAISELKGEQRIIKKDIEVTTPFPAFIPNNYIEDSSARLKTYKRLSNCEELENLEAIKEELQDVYGLPAVELQNLYITLETRIHLQHLGLKAIQVGGTSIILKFEKSLLEKKDQLRNKVVENFMGKPNIYQFTPDYKVIYTHKESVSPSILLQFAIDTSKALAL